MDVRFWGTRGSLAKPGHTTLRFGGNTSCVEVRVADGTLIVFDCGTGAHELGWALSWSRCDGRFMIMARTCRQRALIARSQLEVFGAAERRVITLIECDSSAPFQAWLLRRRSDAPPST